MNERERFIETLTFGRPDRIPFSPGGPRESTVAFWRQTGLPEGADWRVETYRALGLPLEPARAQVDVQADFRMIPQFEEKVLERRERTLVVQDWKGNICEISDKFGTRHLRQAIDFVTRRWIKCPVESRADWEAMKQRYALDAPGRLDSDLPAKGAKLADRAYVWGFGVNGPFWQMREWLGFEGLCMAFLDDPAMVRDMVAFWSDFVSRMFERILAYTRPDYVHFSEDMAYKEKAMISPAMSREFLLPCWRRWCEQLKAAGVPVIDMDSDGYIGELIPLWIEAGINVCDPIEVAAGNDINQFRRQFGRRIAYRQGVDKRAIAKGGQVIRDELARIEPVVRDGGFIPGCDHGVPADITWPKWIDYCRLLAKMTGWL